MSKIKIYFHACFFQFFEDTYSPTVEAALRLQPRCSGKVERDSDLISLTTRLLVPTSRIVCLIGKGGSIINEMRKITKANIRILSKEGLPKVAAEDDEMVQVSILIRVVKLIFTKCYLLFSLNKKGCWSLHVLSFWSMSMI